jgi:hypothetical protein
LRTLVIPFVVLDRRSGALLVDYSNSRNIEWERHEEIIDNKTKRDDIIKKIQEIRSNIDNFLDGK